MWCKGCQRGQNPDKNGKCPGCEALLTSVQEEPVTITESEPVAIETVKASDVVEVGIEEVEAVPEGAEVVESVEVVGEIPGDGDQNDAPAEEMEGFKDLEDPPEPPPNHISDGISVPAPKKKKKKKKRKTGSA